MRLRVITGGLLLGLIASFSWLGIAQAPVDAFSGIQWVQTLGSGTARCVLPERDGGYLLSGWKKGEPGTGSTIFLIKTDRSGQKIWETVLPGNGFSCAYALCPGSSGGTIVVGDTKSKTAYDHDVWAAEIDADGHKVWERNFGGPACDYGAAVLPCADGGYLIAGGTESYGAGCYDVYLIRLDQEGHKIWAKTYGGPGSDCAYALMPAQDGGYILAGNTDSTESGQTNIYLLKINAQGKLLWEQKYGGSHNCYAWAVQPVADGGYIIAGEREEITPNGGGFKSYLLKTDGQGKLIWEHIYSEDSYSTAYALVSDQKGDAILLGKQETAGRGQGLYIMKTDHRGRPVFQKTMTDLNGSCAYAGQQTSDNGYIVAGQTRANANNEPRILLLKLAPKADTWPIAWSGWIALIVTLSFIIYVARNKCWNQDVKSKDR